MPGIRGWNFEVSKFQIQTSKFQNFLSKFWRFWNFEWLNFHCIFKHSKFQKSWNFEHSKFQKKVPRKKFEHSKFLRGYSHLPEIKNWNFETSKFQLFWNFVLSKFQIQTSKFQSHSFEVPKILADPFEVPASKFQPLVPGIVFGCGDARREAIFYCPPKTWEETANTRVVYSGSGTHGEKLHCFTVHQKHEKI